MQIALLRVVAGKIKNRAAIVTIFHTYTEIAALSFGPIPLLEHRNRIIRIGHMDAESLVVAVFYNSLHLSVDMMIRRTP